MWVVATRNRHKLAEIREIIQEHFKISVKICTGEQVLQTVNQEKDKLFLMSLPKWVPDSPEPYSTYLENARSKALWAYKWLSRRGIDLPVIAEDSGLEVKYLGGAPGVRSARWIDERLTAEERNRILLKLLSEARDWEKREARFVATIVAVYKGNDGKLHEAVFTGEMRGWIARHMSGSGGFGYDPVFIPEDCPGCTVAELPPRWKNRISHRAKAVIKWITWLKGGNYRI